MNTYSNYHYELIGMQEGQMTYMTFNPDDLVSKTVIDVNKAEAENWVIYDSLSKQVVQHS